MKIGRVTLSDRASGGIYEDRSGPEIERVLREQFAEEIEFECVLLPDEQAHAAIASSPDRITEGLAKALNTAGVGIYNRHDTTGINQ